MPIIQVHLIRGRSDEQKASFIRALSAAAVDTLGAPIETVRVILQEVPSTDFGIGGETAKARGR